MSLFVVLPFAYVIAKKRRAVRKETTVKITRKNKHNSSHLRTEPISVTAHIFVRFKTMRRKQNLASAVGIQQENWG